MKDSQRKNPRKNSFLVSISRRIMKDSQRRRGGILCVVKYIKANNERFSTLWRGCILRAVSISRRIMKDSQPRSSTTLTAA